MSEVKRYDLVGDMDGNCNLNEARMELSDDGVYVKHKDYEALEAKCAELAVENVGLKESRNILVENTLETCNEIASAGFRHEAIMRGLYKSTGNRNKYPKPITTLVDEALCKLETTATDAFLAEIRAQGVEMFADNLLCPDLDGTIRDFAAKLRKGGGQK